MLGFLYLLLLVIGLMLGLAQRNSSEGPAVFRTKIALIAAYMVLFAQIVDLYQETTGVGEQGMTAATGNWFGKYWLLGLLVNVGLIIWIHILLHKITRQAQGVRGGKRRPPNTGAKI